MSGQEFVDWMAYERLEPFGPLADEYRIGQVCATLANINRGKDTDAFSASDFMPALRRAIEAHRPASPLQDTLTPDQHAALMDAELFGVSPTQH